MGGWGYSGNTSSKLAPQENDITAKPGLVMHESALKLGPNGKAAIHGLSNKSERRSTLLILPLPPKLGFPEGKKLGFNGTTSTPPVAMGAQPPFPLHRMWLNCWDCTSTEHVRGFYTLIFVFCVLLVGALGFRILFLIHIFLSFSVGSVCLALDSYIYSNPVFIP